jgi:hypothetical protein
VVRRDRCPPNDSGQAPFPWPDDLCGARPSLGFTQCEEQYFAAPAYKRLEAIARQRERLTEWMTETVCVPLAADDMALE